MTFDNPTRQIKPQPISSALLAPLSETLEQKFLLLWGDTNSGVFYFQDNFAIAGETVGDQVEAHNDTSYIGIANGVTNQIGEQAS